MGLISAQPVIVGGYPTGALQPHAGGGNTLVLDGSTGAVASIRDGILTEAPAGSASRNELCWSDGPFLIFRPDDGKTYWFKYTADGVVTGL